MDDDVGFFEELPQTRQEVLLIGGGQELPVFREYLVMVPALVFRVVFFGHGLAKDMTSSPGDDGITFSDIVLFPFSAAIWPQIGGNGFTDIRFFCNIKRCHMK